MLNSFSSLYLHPVTASEVWFQTRPSDAFSLVGSPSWLLFDSFGSLVVRDRSLRFITPNVVPTIAAMITRVMMASPKYNFFREMLKLRFPALKLSPLLYAIFPVSPSGLFVAIFAVSSSGSAGQREVEGVTSGSCEYGGVPTSRSE